MHVAIRTAPWTQERFIDWAGCHEQPYEFDGDGPVAMTGGTVTHSRLLRSLNWALGMRHQNSPCESIRPEEGVQTTGDAIRYPDALVTCTPVAGDARLVSDVVVLFVVLSPTSGRTDRIAKLREYAAISTVRHYVILEYDTAALTEFERAHPGETWRAFALTPPDTLLLPDIGTEIPVAEFYEGIAFPDPGPVPGR